MTVDPAGPQHHQPDPREGDAAATSRPPDAPGARDPEPTPARTWGRRLGGVFLFLALADVLFRQAVLTFGAAACVLGMFGLVVVEGLRTGVARTRWFEVRRQEGPLVFWLFLAALALGAVAMAGALVAIGAARRARAA